MKPFKFVIPVNLDDYLTPKSMYPVFQPVLSLKTSAVIGYESFIRFDINGGLASGDANDSVPEFSPEDALRRVKENGTLLLFDKNCFKASAKTARAIGLKKKLFINICAGAFFDKDFQNDYIARHLAKYSIEPSSAVLEISEKDFDGLDSGKTEKISKTVENFRAAGIQIALDNFGSRDLGLKKIYQLNPNFVKLDRSIVRGISSDNAKQSMAKTLVSFCQGIGCHVTACGVESGDELKTLVSLGLDAAQGFFIAEPARFFASAGNESYSIVSSYLYSEKTDEGKSGKTERSAEKGKGKNPSNSAKSDKKSLKAQKDGAESGFKNQIAIQDANGNSAQISNFDKNQKKNETSSQPRRIGDFCVYGVTFSKDAPVPEILQLFQANLDCQLAVIVDGEKRIEGIVSRSKFLGLFSSQYGFNLYSKKSIGHLMEKDFLAVDENETLVEVSAQAMERSEETVYSPVVVESHGKYKGIVTIKRLLDTIVNVEVAEKTKDLMLKNKILTKQRLVQSRDMHMAELVQKSFYKAKPPVTDEWEAAFCFRPMASVSGDVYDFYMDKKNGKFLGCSLFDVSGHGVASGLVGILSKYLAGQVFKSSLDKNLDDMLRKFNSLLSEAKGMVENYLTGVFIRTNGAKIEYVNAGHPDVLIKKSGEKAEVLGSAVKNFRGSFIGIEGLPDGFKTVEDNVESGSYILLYTDCLVESRNLMGFELDQSALLKVFSRACAGKSGQKSDRSAETVLSSLLESFDSFTEGVPLKDDLTVVVKRYN